MVGFGPYTWNDCEQRKRKRCLKDPILGPCQRRDCLGKEVRYALTWYSSTHKKGDSGFLRSATIRTHLIG